MTDRFNHEYYERRVRDLLNGGLIDVIDLKHVLNDEDLADLRALLPDAMRKED